MSRPKGGLGNRLNTLLPDDTHGGPRDVLIARVRPNPRQPRTHFDETALAELAASIREHGIIQPLIVTQADDESYELIAGERRWRAAQLAGVARVPVLVRETTPQQLLELALIENVQRADLSALEEAHAYQALKDDFGLSDEQIARRIGKNTREAVANTRRLLQLPPAAQDALLKGQISAGHGRALLKLKVPEQQLAALHVVLNDELTVREAERLSDLVDIHGGEVELARAMLRGQRAARTNSRGARASSQKPSLSADDHNLQRELERSLGTPVSLRRSDKEMQITITFHTEEKLQEFFDMLQATQAR
ncbi:MAG TPA: ParB/RepB/Spo0J family partition protein [Roseiflexaceae bacterium]|nr:ParB/RepB/Spo0J family partition protein [Roseiflexaceae bacterium]